MTAAEEYLQRQQDRLDRFVAAALTGILAAHPSYVEGGARQLQVPEDVAIMAGAFARAALFEANKGVEPEDAYETMVRP